VLFEKYYKGLSPVYFAHPYANSNLTSPVQNLPLNSSHGRNPEKAPAGS